MRGLQYLELNGLRTKRSSLSLSNHTLFDLRNDRIIADFPNDILSPLKWYKKLFDMRGPGQEFVFCHPASNEVLSFFTSGIKSYNASGDLKGHAYGSRKANVDSIDW